MDAAVIGGAGQVLTEDEVTSFVGDVLGGAGLDGRSVCVIVPGRAPAAARCRCC